MRYRVLGPVEVEREGLSVGVGGPQQRRLLGMLLVHRNHVVSSDRLADALWSADGPPGGASRSLPTYVSRLRSALGSGRVVAQASGYRLDPGSDTCDVDQFEALVGEAGHSLPDRAIECYDQALSLWRGPAFGEFTAEWWALAESTRLGEMRLVAREQRAAALIAIGHHNRAVPDLDSLAVDQPLRERPISLLMQALHATGRQTEALRTFHTYRKRLVEETGLDPTAELARLAGSISGNLEVGADVGSGRPLRGYTLHEAIGEGAFGRVYSATQPGTTRRVAIKVIRPDLADSAKFIQRFEAEAQLVARMEHPHIVPLYDYWREPGGAFLVFRFLGGGTARDAVISGGPWTLARVSRLLEEVGGALIAAHATDVAHNDVKASNVLLDDDGGAYLTDFGIALQGADDVSASEAQRQDLRGLGWLLWELLTGSSRAALATHSSTARQRADEATPSLIGRGSAAPDGLSAVLAKATSADGGYASVAEFVLAWRVAVGHPDGVLTPVTSDERLAVDSARRLAARRLAQDTAAGVNPYKGLRPFGEADAAGFFGRAEAVEVLAQMVDRQPLVTVVGASGSGKSSIVRAGLVPRLRRAGYTVAAMIPGDTPLAAFHAAMSEVSAEPQPRDDPMTVVGSVARDTDRLVIVIDQFEECWTRGTPKGRDEFLRVIARITSGQFANVRVVVTVRADMFDRPLQHPMLGHLVGDGSFVVSPLSPAQLDDVVVLPAARAAVMFDQAVVTDLVADAAGQPGSLPLLQFTLTELYDRRIDGHIGYDALTAIGGMSGAIGRRAETVFESCDSTAQLDARELFGRLVVPGNGAPDARRRARLGELSTGARAVADRFVDARLLVTDRDQATREPTVEVAHEALLARWPRLAGWIDDDRRWLTQLQHLALAARSWDEAGRGGAELYRGARLELAIEALDLEGRTVSDVERQFVNASRTARDSEIDAARRTTRRLRRLLVGVAAALVVAIVAGAVAFVQRRDARTAADVAAVAERQAKIEALLGRVVSTRSTQRDTAALLAVEAFRLADTPRTRSALLSTFTSEPGFLDTHRLDQAGPFGGIVLADGVSAFVTDAAGRVRPYDLDRGERGDPLMALAATSDPASTLSASADSRLLAQVALTHGADGADTSTIGIFDTVNHTLVTAPIEVNGAIAAQAVFGAGDKTLYVASDPDAAVFAYDIATGAKFGELPALADPAVDPFGPVRQPGGLAAGPGDRLIVGSSTGAVRVVDTGSFQVMSTITVPPNTTTSLHQLGDGTSIIGSGSGGVIRFDTSTRSITWQHIDPSGTCVNMTVVEQTAAVFCGDQFGRLEERDLATGERRRTFDAQNGNSGTLWPAKNGAELISFANDEPLVARWRLDGSGPITHLAAYGWLADRYSPDGRLLLVDNDPASVEQSANGIIDAASGTEIASFTGLIGPDWVDNDTLVGAVLRGDDMQAAHYELATGKMIDDGAVFPRPDMGAVVPAAHRAFLLYRPTDATAEVWTIDSARRVQPTIDVDTAVTSMAVSPTGDRVALGTDAGIIVYDGRTGSELGRIPGSTLRGANITASGQLFVASLGGQLTLYDLATLLPVRTFGGSRGFVSSLIGSADGTIVAVLSGDRRVILYDVATGVRLGDAFPVGDNESNYLTLKPDGTQLALGGGLHDSVKIWDLDPQHWIAAACRMAGRNLTHEEWATYIGDLTTYHTTCPGLPQPTTVTSAP